MTSWLRQVHFQIFNDTFTRIPILGPYWSISGCHFLQQVHITLSSNFTSSIACHFSSWKATTQSISYWRRAATLCGLTFFGTILSTAEDSVHPVNCWMLLIGLFMLPKSRPHCLHTRRSRISFVEGQDNRKEYLFEIPFFAFSRRRLALKARFWNRAIYLDSLSDFVHLILKGSSKGLSTFISKDVETNTF